VVKVRKAGVKRDCPSQVGCLSNERKRIVLRKLAKRVSCARGKATARGKSRLAERGSPITAILAVKGKKKGHFNLRPGKNGQGEGEKNDGDHRGGRGWHPLTIKERRSSS